MPDCLTGDEVAALAAGRPPARGATAAEQHLRTCERCRAALAASATEDSVSTPGQALDTTWVVSPAPGRYQYAAAADGTPEELGRGGFGKVLLARDLMLGRDVAVKLLTTRRLTQGRDVAEERLLREARVMGQLEHPAIVPLHELGRDASGALYYTMRRIRGRTLAEAIAAEPGLEGRLRLLPHVLTACHAMAYAHSRGVVHRDLKPQNVMLDRFGATYVIDWGLAHAGRAPDEEPTSPEVSGALRLVASDETIGDGRGRLGTTAYMSPEQLDGPRALVDEKSDVWGLGALLFQVLTGHPPRGRTASGLDLALRTVHELAPTVPPELAAIGDKACAQSRELRYQSAEALAKDLDAWLHGRLVSAHTYRPVELLRRFVREHRVALVVAAAGLSALLVGGTLSFLRVREQRNHARTFAHLIIGQVLERLNETRDAQFAASLTSTVAEWLRESGQDDDAGAVAWAWFQMARGADEVAVSRQDLVRSCLEAAQRGTDVTARAASLGCRALLAVPFDANDLDATSVAALAALEAEPAPAGSQKDRRWLTARHLVLHRLYIAANARADLERERELASKSLSLARQLVAVAPTDGTALVLLASALGDSAVVASNAGDGVLALALADEAVAVARQAVAARSDTSALEALAITLFEKVSHLGWFARTAGPKAEAERVAAGAEARRLFEALQLLAPGGNSISQAQAALQLELGDPAAAWDVIGATDFAAAGSISQGTWAFAALASGHRSQLMAQRAAIDLTPEFDTLCAVGLAMAVEGRFREAAGALRQARSLPLSSSWIPGLMEGFARSLTGPAAPAVARFVEAMTRAISVSDDQAIATATEALARELEGLAP